MIEIYGAAATRTRRCLWVAEECGIEYDLHPVKPNTDDVRSSAFLAINPNGRVPALVDGDLVLFESAAIALYLARSVPSAGLIPSDPADAGRHDQWLFWIMSELEQPLWTLAKHRNRLPEELRVTGLEPACMYELDQHLAVLREALAGRDFLVGGHFTVADVFAAHTLMWARSSGVDIGDELVRYMKLHGARPAFAATRRWD